MPRVLVRYSINGEGANVTGNKIRVTLGGWGIERIGTGALEGEGSPEDMIGALRELLDLLNEPPGGGVLDHVWIYVDNPEPA